MSGRVDLSVVISTFNTRALLEACLRSLLEDLARSDFTYEVIVVDDASTDGSAEMVAAQFPQVRLITQTENGGYARGNNAGVRAAVGRAVLLLNSDTVVRPGCVSSLFGALVRRKQPVAVGPTLLNADGTVQRSCWRFPLASLLGNTMWLFSLKLLNDYEVWDGRTDREVDWISSAALLVRAVAFVDVGFFDERFGVYGVDVDWALRARRKGYRFVQVAGPMVVHHGRASWGEARARMYSDHLHSHGLLFRKHYGPLGLALYRSVVLVNSMIRMLFWGLLAMLGKGRLDHKVAHFRRLIRWSVMGDSRL